MNSKAVSFKNGLGQALDGVLYSQADNSPHAVIFCHGLLSSKESVKIKKLAPSLTSAGYQVLAFNFSFVQEIEGGFTNLSLLQEVDDLGQAIAFMKKQGAKTINLLGSSMGGVVALLYCAENPQAIKSLTLIATPIELTSMIRKIAKIDDLDSLPADGVTDISGVFIQNSFFHEIKNINPKELFSKFSIPVLILQGDQDELITIDQTRAFYDQNLISYKLVIIPGGDHSLFKENEIAAIEEHLIPWLIKTTHI